MKRKALVSALSAMFAVGALAACGDENLDNNPADDPVESNDEMNDGLNDPADDINNDGM
ncbi:hypothetical protein [Alkalicoccus chagannorensis]|uniref:hypothetical protein n=1 Tax=Alkalicoccus chagannorensis TaxID=427072 RepID=UPI000406DCB5|nr:hypothetical protein [Alkalicoccus chagannorensis]